MKLLISKKNKFVLLMPWKTASTTLHLRLSHFNESPYSRFYEYNLYLNRVVHQHLVYSDFLALPEGRQDYFVGSFVRNPYDRVYSGFVQLQRDIKRQPLAPFPQEWVKSLVMRQLAENFAQLAQANFDFDSWFELIGEHQIFEVGRNSSCPLHPAHYWTGLSGIRQLNFIGSVENFEHDYDKLCGELGIEIPPDRMNANLTRDEPPPSGITEPVYVSRMNAATKSKINSLFDEDFRLFGYQKIW